MSVSGELVRQESRALDPVVGEGDEERFEIARRRLRVECRTNRQKRRQKDEQGNEALPVHESSLPPPLSGRVAGETHRH